MLSTVFGQVGGEVVEPGQNPAGAVAPPASGLQLAVLAQGGAHLPQVAW